MDARKKYWKASEYRSILLFYGAPVLTGILTNERFCHYVLLVNAVHILLKCGSTEFEVQKAENMLFTFCERFSDLYNECYMTLNVHQLVHLADSVRYLGPLYTHSCFSFEDKNGAILKMIRGSQCIDSQVTSGISFLQKLPELKQKCIKRGSEEEKLYDSIESPYLLKRVKKISDGVYVLGSIKERKLSPEEFRALGIYLAEMPETDTFLSFNRIEINGLFIYGRLYKRMQKRDDSVISYRGKDGLCYGRVHSFLHRNNEDKFASEYLAVVEILTCTNYRSDSSILSVMVTANIEIIPVSDIKSSCMFICCGEDEHKGFVCHFPNTLESD